MTVRDYPNYRHSGVGWLGSVPSHWRVTTVKRVLSFSTGWTPPTDNDMFYDGTIPWANISDLGPRSIGQTSKTISQLAVEMSRMDLVPAGSLLFSFKLSVGLVSIADIDMYTNEAIAAFRPSNEIHVAYLYYAAPLCLPQNSIENIYGAKLLSRERIANAILCVPPLIDQISIAAFLDQETAKIDALVGEQYRLIALLREKQLSAISHGVTKGLELGIRLKDSGAEWLGQVPRSWGVVSARRLFKERDHRSETGEEDLLTVSHLTGVTLRSEKNVTMIEAETTEGYKICQSGDLVINTLWAWMGAMGISPVHGIVSPAYNIYVPCDGLDPSYVGALVRMPVFAREASRYSKGVWSSRLRLYPEGFFNIRMPLPPLEVQRDIVSYVETLTSASRKLIAEAERAISLLKERRAALISAAVTGKIDVRALAPPVRQAA